MQECHEDHVAAPPPGAVALAASTHTPLQAFAHGPLLRAIQFHPEFNTARLRALLESDPAWLDRIRPGLTASTLNSLREAPLAARFLANWLEAYVRVSRAGAEDGALHPDHGRPLGEQVRH